MKSGGKLRWPSPAMVVAVIALVVAVAGSSYAASSSESVGSNQLKHHAVTSRKIADDAIGSSNVARHSINGDDIKISSLGTVPSSRSTKVAGSAAAIGGHRASCPSDSVLISGACFDRRPNRAVQGVKAASDDCAAKGGYLPKPLDLWAARGALSLGDGTAAHSQFTDSYVIQSRPSDGSASTATSYAATTVVNENGLEAVVNEAELGKAPVASFQFICTYRLIR
jgi:uncharacterized Zn-binding protein involved in type VI secretion